MNNLKNNIRRAPRRLARRKSARGCEPTYDKLSSQLFSLFPILSVSKGTSYFNDALGTTVGSKSNGKYSPAALTAFGENLSVDSPTPTQNSNFFTGKPYVEGLGHAFWMRNHRAGLAKWQTADPMGYPDGWNQLAYCGNVAISAGGGILLTYAVLQEYVFTEARICIGEYYVYEDSKRTITCRKRLIE